MTLVRFPAARWDATWPCDRFAFQLIEYEEELRRPYRFSHTELSAVVGRAVLVGAAGVTLLAWAGGKLWRARR